MKKEDKNNNLVEKNEEIEILTLIDASMHDEGSSATKKIFDTSDYDEVLSLLSHSRSSITPDVELFKQILAKIPSQSAKYSTSSPLGEKAIRSQYFGSRDFFFGRATSWKFATPVLVIFFALVTIIGVTPKKKDSFVAPITTEDSAISIQGSAPQPTAFSLNEDTSPSEIVQPFSMAKMSQTTIASATPQSVGELVTLLSFEADGDINLGTADADDPLYSIDFDSVNAIQQSYDIQTI